MSNLFEYATRNKIRFSSIKGELSVEQLWDVPLRSKDGFDLDAIAKTANKAWKSLTEESFVETKRTVQQSKAETALEIVKYVIDTKLEEEAKAVQRAKNRDEREYLLKVLAEKQLSKLSDMSVADIEKRIKNLTNDSEG